MSSGLHVPAPTPSASQSMREPCIGKYMLKHRDQNKEYAVVFRVKPRPQSVNLPVPINFHSSTMANKFPFLLHHEHLPGALSSAKIQKILPRREMALPYRQLLCQTSLRHNQLPWGDSSLSSNCDHQLIFFIYLVVIMPLTETGAPTFPYDLSTVACILKQEFPS